MAQFAQHRITNSDQVRTGNAVSANRAVLGVPFAGKSDGRYNGSNLVVLSLGAPATASANAAAVSQSVGAAGSFILNGALAAGTPAVVTFDVPRNVVAAWTTTSVLTITGTDEYGQVMVEASASGTSHTGKKAFKTITGVVSSAAITLATVGTGVVLGLAFRPVLGGFIRGRVGEDTADAGTYAAPERAAATTTTNDVRGTYAPAGTPNGSLVFTVLVAIANGPTDADGFGITQ